MQLDRCFRLRDVSIYPRACAMILRSRARKAQDANQRVVSVFDLGVGESCPKRPPRVALRGWRMSVLRAGSPPPLDVAAWVAHCPGHVRPQPDLRHLPGDYSLATPSLAAAVFILLFEIE